MGGWEVEVTLECIHPIHVTCTVHMQNRRGTQVIATVCAKEFKVHQVLNLMILIGQIAVYDILNFE